MEIIEYEIQQDDTLASIAEKHNITVEELVNFHNQHCGITQQIYSNEIPFHIAEIKIPLIEKIEEEAINDTENVQKARYRCEQINTSKINGSLAHFVQQNFQYIMKKGQNSLYYVKMEDYHFDSNPTFLIPSLNFISKTEFIKHNVSFKTCSNNGRLLEILNKEEIYNNWEDFKKKDFYEDDFIKQLQKTNTYAIEDLLKKGNTQFSLDYDLAEEEYRRNLFYFILFDKLSVENIEDISEESFDFMSTLVPPIVVPIEFRYNKISLDNGILKYRKVGTMKLNEELISKIKQKYDEIHKPNLKFNYTEYKLEFRVRGELNLETKEIENADLFIIEQIAENIENRCEYHLKKLNNYTA